MKSISALVIGKQWDIVTQGSLFIKVVRPRGEAQKTGGFQPSMTTLFRLGGHKKLSFLSAFLPRSSNPMISSTLFILGKMSGNSIKASYFILSNNLIEFLRYDYNLSGIIQIFLLTKLLIRQSNSWKR